MNASAPFAAAILCAALLTGCSHSVPAPLPTAGTAPVVPAAAPAPAAPMVLTSYPAYQPLSPGQQTKAFPLSGLTPGDNQVPASGGSPSSSDASSQAAVAQGQVSLDDYQFRIKPDGAGGSVLDGSVSVHNHGPYDITDFQISLRESGRLYVLLPPGAGHQIAPAQGTVYTIHAAVPLAMDQLKTGKSFLLEAQLDGPPALAIDEESGTTLTDMTPHPQ